MDKGLLIRNGIKENRRCGIKACIENRIHLVLLLEIFNSISSHHLLLFYLAWALFIIKNSFFCQGFYEGDNSIYQWNREPPRSLWQKKLISVFIQKQMPAWAENTTQTSLHRPFAPHARPPPEPVPFLHSLPGLPWNKIPVLNILSTNFLPTMTKTSFTCFQRIWWDSVTQ